MSKRVAVGLSGGVDSSAAAYILREQGYDVVGVTMKLWDGGCSSEKEIADAENIAEKLGIEFHTLDFRKEFSEYVIDYFTSEYLKGRTPNPCIACNKFLKFEAMAREAERLKADYIATGHYARVKKDEESGSFKLLKAKALEKDQSYVLYNLTQERLKRLILPLGEFEDKNEVRSLAGKAGIAVADKSDSMEICFIPDNDYAGFIKRRVAEIPPEGNFVDAYGNILGRHKGIINYTVGQRKGLGIAFGKPMFVIKIDADKNEVVLGEQGSEYKESLCGINPNFISSDIPSEPVRAEAKIRYSAKPAKGILTLENGIVRFKFDEKQRAITPGQAVVFYDGDEVLGGATII